MSIQTLSEEQLKQQITSSSLPLIVDFGAEWCQPCKRLDPILEELAGAWQGKAAIVRIDVETAPEITMQYQIMNLPTVMLFKNGSPVQSISGLQTRQKLTDLFEPYL